MTIHPSASTEFFQG